MSVRTVRGEADAGTTPATPGTDAGSTLARLQKRCWTGPSYGQDRFRTADSFEGVDVRCHGAISPARRWWQPGRCRVCTGATAGMHQDGARMMPRRRHGIIGVGGCFEWIFGRLALWLLDGERREVQRARDHAGQVVEFNATTWLPKLVEAVEAIGEGFYRLTGRGPDGRIVARRDFEAMWSWRSESEAPQYKPRNEVERVTGALRAAEAATRAAEAARDAAEARAVALEAALAAVVAERDAQVEALERAFAEQQDQLDRVRRLYRRLAAGSGAPSGSTGVDGEARGASDGLNDSAIRRGRSQPRRYHRSRGSAPTTEGGRVEERASAGQGMAGSAGQSPRGKQAPLIDEALIASFERTLDMAARIADRFKGTTSEAPKAPKPAAASPTGPAAGAPMRAARRLPPPPELDASR